MEYFCVWFIDTRIMSIISIEIKHVFFFYFEPPSCCQCLAHSQKKVMKAHYLFTIQGSVHHKCIPFDIFQKRCKITQFIYFWKTALYVSRGISTHHQEHTQLFLRYLVVVKTLLLPAAIVEGLELVFECGVGIIMI